MWKNPHFAADPLQCAPFAVLACLHDAITFTASMQRPPIHCNLKNVLERSILSVHIESSCPKIPDRHLRQDSTLSAENSVFAPTIFLSPQIFCTTRPLSQDFLPETFKYYLYLFLADSRLVGTSARSFGASFHSTERDSNLAASSEPPSHTISL